jgi:acyl-coenzyme A thioesterase 13
MAPTIDLTDSADCPEGFLPLFRTSPFLDVAGPFFYKPGKDGFVVGLRVMNKHTNASGTVHGGLVATLADVSMGYVTVASQSSPLRMITANLDVDFVGMAKPGDWIESHVSVTKAGSRLAFASALIISAGVTIASTKAVFMVLSSPA